MYICESSYVEHLASAVAIGSRIARLFVTLLYMSTKVLYQYIDNI